MEMTSNGKSQNRREWVLAALEEYEGRLTSYAARLLSDEELGRDAVQHTFLRLCEQSPQKLDGRLAAWLFTVCRNKSLDMMRASGRTESVRHEELAEPIGHERDPADVVEDGDVHEGLRRLISQLPASQAEVIDLWLNGFSYREIGEITRRSEGAARVLLHRALTALREHPWTQNLLNPNRASRPAATGGA